MREHAVVEPTTCLYAHVCARASERERNNSRAARALARSLARSLARARVPRRRGCLLVLIYEHTNTRIERRYTRESYREPVSGPGDAHARKRLRREGPLNISDVRARHVRVPLRGRVSDPAAVCVLIRAHAREIKSRAERVCVRCGY